MDKNVGGRDRQIRLGLGSLLLILGIGGYAGLIPVAVGPLPQALTAATLTLVAIILLVTGATQRCPINTLLGKNTCRSAE